MTTLRWCEHCQARTAHHDYMPAGITWIGNRRVEYDADWHEIYCAKCNTISIHYYGEPMPSDDPVYHAHTTDKGDQART